MSRLGVRLTQYCRQVVHLSELSRKRAPLHFAGRSPRWPVFASPGKLNGPNCRCEILTISAHSDCYALLQSAILASISVDAKDGALLILGARPVLDLLLDTASEEALGRKLF